LKRACSRCLAELPDEALACRHCHALVHAAALQDLSASAKAFEETKDFVHAEEQWLKALPLLPPETSQAGWIQEHIRHLRVRIPETTPARSRWPRWIAPAVPILVALSKGKALLALFNAKFILSFGAFFAVYWSLYGTAFALGFVIQILIHEMGHYVDIRRRGLPADMPLFLPGLGAFVRWNALGVSLETRAAVSLAGPLAGCMAAAVCAGLWFATGNGIWGALARSGAWLNLLNLIPVLGLDGGHAFLALTRKERGVLLAASLVLFIFVGDAVLFLITLGAAWRMFTQDYPTEPSRFATAYFTVVLFALAGLVWILPGHGFGSR
jgi:Zn-dependent protease